MSNHLGVILSNQRVRSCKYEMLQHVATDSDGSNGPDNKYPSFDCMVMGPFLHTSYMIFQ